MSKDKIFDPNKPKQVGEGGRVENINLGTPEVQGSIFSSLDNLEDLLRSASVEDYDALFGMSSETFLRRYKDLADQISMNLRRIIEGKEKK